MKQVWLVAVGVCAALMLSMLLVDQSDCDVIGYGVNLKSSYPYPLHSFDELDVNDVNQVRFLVLYLCY